MKNIQLTCAHALVKFLISQKTLIDGKKSLCFPVSLEYLDMVMSHV